MKVPGVAWTALIIALVGVLNSWLTDYVAAPWVPLAVMALGIAAKAAEIYLSDRKTAAANRASEPVASHKIQRFFLGG